MNQSNHNFSDSCPSLHITASTRTAASLPSMKIMAIAINLFGTFGHRKLAYAKPEDIVQYLLQCMATPIYSLRQDSFLSLLGDAIEL